jgi:acetyltransferase-like isoleucine patch superfamily enzyme
MKSIKDLIMVLVKCKWRYLSKRILCFSPIQVHIDKTSSVSISHILKMNCNFSYNRIMHNVTPGSLNITNGSSMNVDYFTFHIGCTISVNGGGNLTIKSGYMNQNGQIDCYESIYIGENVKIGPNVVIRDSDNHLIIREGGTVSAPIRIEDNVWIGLNSVILKGVTIGEGAIIGAGSIVTRDVPPHALAIGVPAKVIKKDIWYK